MALIYPLECRGAVARLNIPYDDFSVFVEDTGITNVHLNLINRILSGIGSIRTVTALGSRKTVINAASEDKSLRNFYIVDGDIDLIRGKYYRKSNIYSLGVYSIENVALHGVDVVDILRDYNCACTPEDIKSRLDLREWESEVEKWFKNLFILYAIVVMNKLDIVTVGYHVNRVLDHEKCCVSSILVKRRYKDILRDTFTQIGRTKFLDDKARVMEFVRSEGLTWRHFVSGKDYLLPFLWLRCKKLCEFKGSKLILLSRFSRTCSFDLDPGYSKAIRRAAKRAMRAAKALPPITFPGSP